VKTFHIYEQGEKEGDGHDQLTKIYFDKDQLSLTNMRFVLHHGEHAANKSDCQSV